jgi:hypothetical protein
MKVTGTKIEKSKVDVEIDPRTVITEIKRQWMKSQGLKWYWIIREGFWQEWEDTHASGFYIKHREATPEEKEVMRVCEVMYNLAKEGERF